MTERKKRCRHTWIEQEFKNILLWEDWKRVGFTQALLVGIFWGYTMTRQWRVPVHQDSDCRRHPLSTDKKRNESEECGGEKL